MEVYIKSNILRQQRQEWTVHTIENGHAVPLFFLRSSGFVEGVAAEVADVNKTIIMEVVQDTYLPGRRMHLRTGNRLDAWSIQKEEHSLDSHKGAVNKYLQSFSRRLSDTFVARHGDREIAQGVRPYPAEEFCINASVAKRTGGHKSMACKVSRQTAANSQKVASALLGKPGVDQGVLQEVYTLQLPKEAGLCDQAHLILMAILMQEASFAPHVALPPIVPVPAAVSDSQAWTMASTPEPPAPPVRAASSTSSLSLPSLCLNLRDEATALLQFLHEVDGTAWLHSEQALQSAVRRYEKFWLPILAKQAKDALDQHREPVKVAAPLDVAWAWLAHSLDPEMYRRDFHALNEFTAMPPTGSAPHRRNEEALEAGKAAWKDAWAKKFPNEPFEIEDSSPKQVADYPRTSTCDIAAAMRRLRAFIYQVALPHWVRDPTVIDKAVTGYRRFLALHKRYPTTNLVPTTGIELIWQAHMANHDAFYRDTKDESDQCFAPNTSTDNGGESTLRKGGLARTKQLYESNFGEAYAQAGAGYRGVPPPDRHLAGAAAVPLKTAGALTTYKITQNQVTQKRQPLAMHIAEDMPAGGVAVCLLAATSKCAKRYHIWLCHNGPNSRQASVHVLDSKDVVVATARLVGREQLPVKDPGGMVGANVQASGFSALPDQAYPALLSYRNPRHPSEHTAFLISSRSHDWGVVSAVWHGHVSSERTHVSTNQKGVINIGSTGEPGHLAVRLCRLGKASEGICLAYKTAKSQGGSKFSFSASTNSSPSIVLKMETPTEVSVAAGENAACALAFAGAVSLQAMMLGLPLAGLTKSKFAAGLLAAHGVSLAAVIGRHDLRAAPGSLPAPSPKAKEVACEEELFDEEEADARKLETVSLTAGDALDNMISAPKSSAEKKPYAKWHGTVQQAYNAAVPDAELSVYEGEQVEVVGERDGWLHCVAPDGEGGLVPASAITQGVPDQRAPMTSPFASEEVQQHAKPEFNPLAEPDLLSAVCHGTPKNNSWSNDFSEQHSSPFHQPHTPNAFDRAAGFGDSYQGRASGGATADIVGVMSRLTADDQYEARSLSTSGGADGSCRKTTYARVISDFEAEMEEELSVVAGDEVAVIGTEDDGWIQVARARDGREGLVPVSYLSTS